MKCGHAARPIGDKVGGEQESGGGFRVVHAKPATAIAGQGIAWAPSQNGFLAIGGEGRDFAQACLGGGHAGAEAANLGGIFRWRCGGKNSHAEPPARSRLIFVMISPGRSFVASCRAARASAAVTTSGVAGASLDATK